MHTHTSRETQTHRFCLYLSLDSGGPDAGQVDGFVFSRVQFNHHGVSIDHLHHLEGQRKRGEQISKLNAEGEHKEPQNSILNSFKGAKTNNL